ncbi:hypothetical protein ARMSODRAFT_577850 [Armillaria solidipes]|uniref:Uncharacterized protein n=1 Tax=Armillaria solidipes TaxID=1076256 RepID=A0A2H3BTK9_9AGAR|nr:hypothetical protein ARMSODRAFT_577850 [Armillaria solidipes]
MPLRPKPTTRKERLDKRSDVPVVAAKIKSMGFFAQRFVKRLARSSLCVVRRLKRDWREFCGEQPEHNPLQVYPEIDIDTKLPPREAFIAFTTHQALSSKGCISEYSTRDTIHSLMGSFFEIWRREALQPVPSEYTQQVYTYIDSEQLEKIVPLCTDSMPRHSMSATDFEVLTRALFRDTGFRTLRMVLQVAYFINIQSLIPERPEPSSKEARTMAPTRLSLGANTTFTLFPTKTTLIILSLSSSSRYAARKGTRGKSLYTKSLSSRAQRKPCNVPCRPGSSSRH